MTDEATPRRRRMDTDVESLRKDLQTVKEEVGQIKSSVQDLVDAWQTAGRLVAFVKWLSGFAAAIVLLVEAMKIKW